MKSEKKKNNRNIKKVNKKDDKLQEKSYKNKFLIALKEYWNFYKENIRKKHIVLYIVALIIFFVFVVIFLNSLDMSNQINNLENIKQKHNILNVLMVEKLPLVLVIIFAGITPFVYLSTLGIFTSYDLALKLVDEFLLGNSINIVVLAIGMIVQLFGIGMAMATGYYYCSLSSKRFRYSQSKGYSLNDVKEKIYMATKNKEKLERLNKKMEEKSKKNEKLNVKIPYKMLLVSALFAFIIVLIGTIITQGV